MSSVICRSTSVRKYGGKGLAEGGLQHQVAQLRLIGGNCVGVRDTKGQELVQNCLGCGALLLQCLKTRQNTLVSFASIICDKSDK